MLINPKMLPFCFLLLIGVPLSAREKSDILVMRNGDRFTCEIKSLDADTLSIGLDYASGTIAINWDKVEHVESKQLFLVKTQDGPVFEKYQQHGDFYRRWSGLAKYCLSAVRLACHQPTGDIRSDRRENKPPPVRQDQP
jgi:hypothetical protein